MATVTLPGRMGQASVTVKVLAGLLVLAALGLGIKTVWFDQTRYLVPARFIPVGANLAAEKWRAVSLNLGSLAGTYLTAEARPIGFAQAGMPAGQLVAASQVGRFAPETKSRLVITNKTTLGSGVRSGAVVAIWSTKRLGAGLLDSPKLLVAKATVARVIKAAAVFGAQSQQVEVLVSPVQAPQLLEALASDSPLFLVAGQ